MKHLKNFLALMLAFALLAMSCAAFAEDLPYMEQLSQDKYYSTMLLPNESYPEVCLSPYYFSSMYVSQYSEPYFVHFPCPADTLVAEFDTDSCSFINMDYGRQYSYAMHDSAAFETFVNQAEKDEYILNEGTDGAAIFLAPDDARANALIAVKEIGKNVKLQVSIYDSSLKNKSEQQIIDSLSAQITEEVARIQGSLRVDLMDTYWTEGRYAGFKQICDTDGVDGLIMTYTLPEGYFIKETNFGEFSFVKLAGKGNAIDVEVSMDTYSYVDYKLEEEPEHVTTVDIDGVEYRIYAYWYDDKEIISAYVDCAIAENVGYGNDDTLRLTFDLDPEGSCEWLNLSALEADVATIVRGAKLDFGQNIPDYRGVPTYAGSSAPAADAPAVDAPAIDVPANDAPTAPASEAWTCPSCGSENNGGKFCSNCGTPRPAEEQPIVCSNCGYQPPEGEIPKFCPECGTQF